MAASRVSRPSVGYGIVGVRGGPHDGRIGDYDNDDEDERGRFVAVVYFGDMLQVAPHLLSHRLLREVTLHDLRCRREALSAMLFPVRARGARRVNREAAQAELLLVERSLAEALLEDAATATADDIRFMELSIVESRKSVQEPGRADPSPRVGVVTVKNGIVIAQAHRNERGEHGEFVALQRILGGRGEAVGATAYTTLEPCTERGKGKTPCTNPWGDPPALPGRHPTFYISGVFPVRVPFVSR